MDDTLKSFESWMRYQAVDPSALRAEELASWRGEYETVLRKMAELKPVGRMKLPKNKADQLFAVAVPDITNLWLLLWVKWSEKGECFVLAPRNDHEWDVHSSYHRNGTIHHKGYGHKMMKSRRQPLNGDFRGAEQIVTLAPVSLSGARTVGAVCERADFSSVVMIPVEALRSDRLSVAVDLVEPGRQAVEKPWSRIVYKRRSGWICCPR